jgi:hypothetical protein
MGRKVEGRPVGWGPEAALQWLRDNPAGKPEELWAEIASRCTPVFHPQTIYVEVCKWKRENRAFREEFNRLVAERKIPGPHKNSVDYRDPDWRERWKAAYLQNRSYAEAAAAVGLGQEHLRCKRTKGHTSFDQAYFDTWVEATAAAEEHYEDTVNWAIDEARSQGDPKTAGSLAITVLERVNKRRWSRSEERQINGKITVEHGLTPELTALQRRAQVHAEITSQRLGFVPKVALPAGEQAVIDVEAQPVPVAAEKAK